MQESRGFRRLCDNTSPAIEEQLQNEIQVRCQFSAAVCLSHCSHVAAAAAAVVVVVVVVAAGVGDAACGQPAAQLAHRRLLDYPGPRGVLPLGGWQRSR